MDDFLLLSNVGQLGTAYQKWYRVFKYNQLELNSVYELLRSIQPTLERPNILKNLISDLFIRLVDTDDKWIRSIKKVVAPYNVPDYWLEKMMETYPPRNRELNDTFLKYYTKEEYEKLISVYTFQSFDNSTSYEFFTAFYTERIEILSKWLHGISLAVCSLYNDFYTTFRILKVPVPKNNRHATPYDNVHPSLVVGYFGIRHCEHLTELLHNILKWYDLLSVDKGRIDKRCIYLPPRTINLSDLVQKHNDKRHQRLLTKEEVEQDEQSRIALSSPYSGRKRRNRYRNYFFNIE